MAFKKPLSNFFSDNNYGLSYLRELARDVLVGLSEDTSPTLGGNLDAASYNISSIGTLGATTINATTYQQDSTTLSNIIWKDVTVTSTLLQTGGTVTVIAGGSGDQFKIRNIYLVGGGTNFSAVGDRTIILTDSTTTWTTVPNASIEAAPATTQVWSSTAVPFNAGTSNTASAAGSTIKFTYSGGTTDHNAGSINFSVCLEKVA